MQAHGRALPGFSGDGERFWDNSFRRFSRLGRTRNPQSVRHGYASPNQDEDRQREEPPVAMQGFGPPIDVRPLIPGERAALIGLLRELVPAEWDAPTACAGWSVADLARHLLGCDVGVLSLRRDGHGDPAFSGGLDVSTFAGIVAAIDRLNERWMVATRRISPRMATDLLELTGAWTADYWAGVDPDAPGLPVDWAGDGPAPAWLDIAREYTERWVHGAQIREAVGAPLLGGAEWLGPVIDACARALPRSLDGVGAPVGTVALLRVTGPAGGEWRVRRDASGWRWLPTGDTAAEPAAILTLDDDTAWRRWTRGIDRRRALAASTLEGDPALLDGMLGMVGILTGEPGG